MLCFGTRERYTHRSVPGSYNLLVVGNFNTFERSCIDSVKLFSFNVSSNSPASCLARLTTPRRHKRFPVRRIHRQRFCDGLYTCLVLPPSTGAFPPQKAAAMDWLYDSNKDTCNNGTTPLLIQPAFETAVTYMRVTFKQPGAHIHLLKLHGLQHLRFSLLGLVSLFLSLVQRTCLCGLYSVSEDIGRHVTYSRSMYTLQ